MIAYLDASVVLRVILREPKRLHQWESIQAGVASALLEVECLRVIDRLRLAKGLTDEQVSERREAFHRLLPRMELVEVDHAVLSRASQPFSTTLGTLDAIHLVSAIVWREQSGTDLAMATHDAALATAARAHGMRVIGV